MKKYNLILMLLFVLAISQVHAQKFQAAISFYGANMLGDFTSSEYNNQESVYDIYAGGSSISFKYYLENNIGFGIKCSFTGYQRDRKSYENDLKEELGITDDNYDITQSNEYWSYSPRIGMSYAIELSNFVIEPYFYIGMAVFVTPIEHAIYANAGTTYTYRKDPTVFYGTSYLPGVSFMWKFADKWGLYMEVEYEAVVLTIDNDDYLVHSFNSFEKTKALKKFTPQSINVGLGVAFQFGPAFKK
ncbi:MAG: hypothetical protein OCD76_11635 [Reichenbachiella sp.]